MFCLDEPLRFEKYPAKLILYAIEPEYVPAHWHHNFELDYLTRGTWQVNIDDVNCRIAAPGIVPVNSQKVHWIRPLEAGTAAKLAIVFDTAFLEHYGFRMGEREFIITGSDHDTKRLEALLQELYQFYADRLARMEPQQVYRLEEYRYLKVNALLYQIAAELIGHFMYPVRPTDNKQERLRRRFWRVCEYITNHYAEDITLQDVAEIMGYSREHCARSFKDYMGMTFKEYLTGTRLVHAYNLLKYSDQTIAEIAAVTGFPNARAFNRSFQQVYKTLPKNMRKEMKKDTIIQKYQ